MMSAIDFQNSLQQSFYIYRKSYKNIGIVISMIYREKYMEKDRKNKCRKMLIVRSKWRA